MVNEWEDLLLFARLLNQRWTKHRQEDVFLADTAKPISGSITTPVAFAGLTISQSAHIKPYAISVAQQKDGMIYQYLPSNTIYIYIVLWYDISIHILLYYIVLYYIILYYSFILYYIILYDSYDIILYYIIILYYNIILYYIPGSYFCPLMEAT